MATRILGIDPGLNRTGWGVIETEGNRLRHIAHGVATSDPADPLAHRLSALYADLAKLIVVWSPDEAAVEEVFVNRNPASTLKLGMARGVALLAPAMAGLPVAEYAANLVKKSVVGTGHADKAQIAMMVRVLLPGVLAGADAADALAVAICHAHHRISPRPSGLWWAAQPPGVGVAPQRNFPQRGCGPTPSPGIAKPMPTSPRRGEVSGGEVKKSYRPKPDAAQIARARALRTDSTDVERVVWQALRNAQLGVKFRRQAPVLGFFADFLSHEAKLIVELDGGQHADSDYDESRTVALERAGFQVLRFWNNEVTENLDGVLAVIAAAIVAAHPPRPNGERSAALWPPGEGVVPQPHSSQLSRGETPSPGIAKPMPTSPRRGEVKST
jgi:crossover junction endodeoxyribonuclease RuvC